MLDIDWSKVPEGCDWAAQDDDGCVFAYAGEPSMFLTSIMGGWEHDGPSVFVKISAPREDWRDSLMRRPEK